jgi:hypothetical protein
MSKHRLEFKLPFFGEAKAEGLAGVVALVIVVIVFVVAMHWPGRCERPGCGVERPIVPTPLSRVELGCRVRCDTSRHADQIKRGIPRVGQSVRIPGPLEKLD